MTVSQGNDSASLLKQQRQWLQQYQPGLRLREQGTLISVGDGIAIVGGLPTVAMGDIVAFADGSLGMVSDLMKDATGVILLIETPELTAGASVHCLHKTLSIPVSNELVGRVIDPLGYPLDDRASPTVVARQPMEHGSPPIVARDFVSVPLYTGIKIVDTLLPIGKGQRQLIIGDEGLGRSSLAIDTVINQRDKDVWCVYVLIGQKRSTVVNTIETLKDNGGLSYTTVVVAEATGLPGLQYLAPFAGCALAEFWMHQGKDVLVIYDDLSTHARTYRELSLLLRHPPGREAYPGDIFSVHASLLERATCLNAAHGGGSMTALPIVETQQGEIAAYIPTNLISITDGQIYLDHGLYSGGFRPAIDIARSVSRVGGQAQHPRIKEESGRIKLDYLQYLELEMFTRFGTRLEASMERAIQRGRILREILKQDRLTPLSVIVHMAWLIAFNDGLFDHVSLQDLPGLMKKLEDEAAHSSLGLDTPRDIWSRHVSELLDIHPEKETS